MSSIHKHIHVNGIVQGVGFRPFIFSLAKQHKLSGTVKNGSKGVDIFVVGTENSLDIFIKEINSKAPPLSQIQSIETQTIPMEHYEDFIIIPSDSSEKMETLISPDVSVCEACLEELFNPENRRYLYPFINCTHCGPRFTIIESIPYDRPFTTMKHFDLCPDCRNEYENPLDRRFHAQPVACPDCGPEVWLEYPGTEIQKENPIAEAARLLMEGKIIAIKGLGGFHLAVDARNKNAVITLRQRKKRDEKPFAVMVESLESAKNLVRFSKREADLLESRQRPILILKRKNMNIPVKEIAPENQTLGVMLPYTPLHYVLFAELKKISSSIPILVMTSANFSEEPIVYKNSEAKEKLSKIVDAFLMHNRDILIRTDDSVLISINKIPRFLRRSRGYVPQAIFLKENDQNDQPILAVGAELKNSLCFYKNNKVFPGQYIGDLTTLSAFEFFKESIGHFQTILDINPNVIAHDLHPQYMSTVWANGQKNQQTFAIQHHHAHMASCMAENKLNKNVIGIILDGTGFGYDGKIWGGEIFTGNYTKLHRFAHLEYLPLPGGDLAVKEPWRIATAYVWKLLNREYQIPGIPDKDFELLLQMLKKNVNTPYTSSCGRLFDAVAVLSGGRSKIRYEAQSTIEFMHCADTSINDSYKLETPPLPEIPLSGLLEQILNDRESGVVQSVISAKFHRTLAELFTQYAILASEKYGLNDVVLSGGVFQNNLFFTHLETQLKSRNFKVWSQTLLPSNDGGISLGQVAITRELLKENKQTVRFTYEVPEK